MVIAGEQTLVIESWKSKLEHAPESVYQAVTRMGVVSQLDDRPLAAQRGPAQPCLKHAQEKEEGSCMLVELAGAIELQERPTN